MVVVILSLLHISVLFYVTNRQVTRRSLQNDQNFLEKVNSSQMFGLNK